MSCFKDTGKLVLFFLQKADATDFPTTKIWGEIGLQKNSRKSVGKPAHGRERVNRDLFKNNKK